MITSDPTGLELPGDAVGVGHDVVGTPSERGELPAPITEQGGGVYFGLPPVVRSGPVRAFGRAGSTRLATPPRGAAEFARPIAEAGFADRTCKESQKEAADFLSASQSRRKGRRSAQSQGA
jgi:hypothetical protein